jgi:hypothetical protein
MSTMSDRMKGTENDAVATEVIDGQRSKTKQRMAEKTSKMILRRWNSARKGLKWGKTQVTATGS